MAPEIDLVTGKPVKNKERELLSALTPEDKAAQKAARAAEKDAKRAASGAGAPAEWVHDAVRRSAAMAVLLELQFLEVGI